MKLHQLIEVMYPKTAVCIIAGHNNAFFESVEELKQEAPAYVMSRPIKLVWWSDVYRSFMVEVEE